MKKIINNPLVGTDFELFLQDQKSKEFISAEGIIRGTKQIPFVFDNTNKFFSTSLDNVLCEATIPPVSNVDEWLANIKKSRNYIESIIPPHLCTVAFPAAVLDDRWLSTPTAQEFGCEEDLNAWKRCTNDRPKADNPNLRSAGAHIHVGYEVPEDEMEKTLIDESIVRTMDLFVGVPSIIQEPENERRKLYGKAGACRFKKYGVEYRTISNYYLASEDLTKWAFGATIKSLDFINDGRYEELTEEVGEQIQDAINNTNKSVAKKLIKKFKLLLA